MLGPFEDEEEGTGVSSDVVKVKGEDPDTPGYLRGDRVRSAAISDPGCVGDLGSWVRLPWLAHDEAPGPYITIPQYQFNKTKQHTRTRLPLLAHDEAPGPYITIPHYRFNKQSNTRVNKTKQ